MIIVRMVIVFLLITTISRGQSPIDVIKKKWKEKDYQAVVTEGVKLRKSLRGVGIPSLDIMIACSLCLQPDKKTKGCALYSYLVEDYYQDLGNRELSLLQKSYTDICTNNKMPDESFLNLLNTQQFSHSTRSAGVTGKFKSYMLIAQALRKGGIFKYIDYGEVMKLVELSSKETGMESSTPIKYIDTLISRRVPKTDTSKLKAIMRSYKPSNKHYISDNFIVITSKASKIKPSIVCNNLERVFRFYQTNFDLPSLSDYILIYLADTYPEVQSSIKRMYKIPVASSPIGFSSIYDNSIMAWIPGDNLIGTLKHELIHLLLRTKFNAPPVWFEEGLASLFEESVFANSDTLKGLNNWRMMVVKENLLKYNLGDLISGRAYQNFNNDLIWIKSEFMSALYSVRGEDSWMLDLYQEHRSELPDVFKALLTNYLSNYTDALSRCFMLYLQETGNLKKVYDLMFERDQSAMDFENESYLTKTKVITNALNKPMDEIERNFNEWMKIQKQKD